MTSIVIVGRPSMGDGGAFEVVLALGLLPVASLAYHGVLSMRDCGEDASDTGEVISRLASSRVPTRLSVSLSHA